MSHFKTLELTDEEELVSKMRRAGKSSKHIAEVLGETQTRVGHLMDRVNRKNAVKERLKIQGNRKLRI